MAGLPYNCRCFTVTGNVAGMPNPSATGNIGGATIPPITGTVPGNPTVYFPGTAVPLIPNLTQITSSASIPAGTLIIATAAGGNGGGVTPFTTLINTACVNNVAAVPYSIGAGGGGGGGGGDPYVIYVKRRLGLSVSTDPQNNTILNFSNPDGSFAGVVLLIKGADGQLGALPNYGSSSTCPSSGPTPIYPSATPGIGGNGGYGFYTGSNGDTGIYQPFSLCPSDGTANVTGITSASGGASILGFAQVRAAYNSCDGLPPVTGGGYGTGGVGCTNAGSPPGPPGSGGASFVGAYYNPTSAVLALFGISA